MSNVYVYALQEDSDRNRGCKLVATVLQFVVSAVGFRERSKHIRQKMEVAQLHSHCRERIV